jgi:FkbM family methyltransferase
MSYSLNNLDVKMEPYLKNIKNGFYIECGANNGIWQSNTLYFYEKYNWKGLLIEPNPHLIEICKKFRPNDIVENYALVNKNYDKNFIKGFFQFTDYAPSLMAQVVEDNSQFTNQHPDQEPISVPAITLTNLLEKHKIEKIDFFSLDVEGYEINVLEGFDIQRFKPKFLLIETTIIEDRQKEIKRYMESVGYKLIERLSDGDDLYVPND